MDKIKASTLADLAYYSRFKPPSRTITFAAPASTLTNFPALVKCNSTFHIGTQTGYDVHFQDLSGNELYYDLDFYDPVTGNGAWWVQIPSLSSSAPTSIKMLYGDSSANTNGSSPATVWAGYLAVYHFNSTNTTQQLNSASGTYGTWSELPNTARSCAFTSGGVTGRMLAVTDGFYWNGPTALTCSTSSAAESPCNYVSVMEVSEAWGNQDRSMPSRLVVFDQAYFGQFIMGTYGGGHTRTTPAVVGTLEYQNATWNWSDTAFRWIINDDLETGTFPCTWQLSTDSVGVLYAYSGYSSVWVVTYKIDELRFRRVMVSQAEAEYERNMLMHHSNYVTYGPEA